MTNLCKCDIINNKKKIIFLREPLLWQEGDSMKDNKITYISVYHEGENVVVALEKSTVIDRFSEAKRNRKKYSVSQSCGRLVDSVETNVVGNRDLSIRVHYPGELFLKLRKIPIYKGDKVRVNKEGQVLIFHNGEIKSYIAN